jgi:hypothetical protein
VSQGLILIALFFQWQPDTLIQVGDKVDSIECVENDFALSGKFSLELPTNLINLLPFSFAEHRKKAAVKNHKSDLWKSKWNWDACLWFQAQRSRLFNFMGNPVIM